MKNLWTNLTLLILLLFFCAPLHTQTVFINEIHYQNDGPDQNERIELFGPAQTDISNWSVEIYDGANGTVAKTYSISAGTVLKSNGSIDGNDYGVFLINIPTEGMLDGEKDPAGLALVDANNTLQQFISYGGQVQATQGAAQGLASRDIGARENPNGDSKTSVALGANGWVLTTNNSFGNFNSNQPTTDDPVITVPPTCEDCRQWDGLFSTTDPISRPGEVSIGSLLTLDDALKIKGDIYGDPGNTTFSIYSGIDNASGPYLNLWGPGSSQHNRLSLIAGEGGDIRFSNRTATSWETHMVIKSDGSVGIGSDSDYPGYKLAVRGGGLTTMGPVTINSSTTIPGFDFVNYGSAYVKDKLAVGVTNVPDEYAMIVRGGGFSAVGPVTINGSVTLPGFDLVTYGSAYVKSRLAVGATSVPAGFQMAVAGGILTEEVKVELCEGSWCDYVFEEDYKLPSLSEVKSFIDAKGHLPNIPAGAVIEADGGFELKSMTIMQQEKIEELFLYIIEMEEKMKTMQEELSQLKKGQTQGRK